MAKTKKVYKLSRGDLTFVILLLFILGFIAGTNLAPEKIIFAKSDLKPASVEGEKKVEMSLPAVDADGNGVVGTLITTVRPGSGQVLVNVNDVLAQFDTQISGRTAAKAASNYTKMDLSNVDIIYDIKVNASIIEGPSAGAALTSSIILALENIPADNKIMMTGTISEDGSIGPIGAVLEKAKAAKDNGATTFLVPKDQGSQLTSNRVRTCRQLDFGEVCQVQYQYSKVNVGSALNLTVEEVNNISDIIKVYQDNLNKPQLISK